MSTPVVHAASPPPCPQKCWEWVAPRAWLYTDRSDVCGHRFDIREGVWRWHNHPTRKDQSS